MGSRSFEREASAPNSSSPSKRSTSPANTKVCPAVSWLTNHSSTSPSTRPPTTTRLPSRRFTWARRTFSISSSTMVPMLRR